MSNGDAEDPKRPKSALETAISLAMRAGWIGIGGMGVALIGEAAQIVWPDSVRIDAFTHTCFIGGAILYAVDSKLNRKRATDMQVTVAREAKQDRAEMINAIAPGAAAVPTSADPAVQRDIDRNTK